MRKFISSLAIITGILGFIATPLFAYVINGQVDDWGITLSDSLALRKWYLDTHLPSGGFDIDYLPTEDNAGNKDKDGVDIVGWQTVGPGSTYGGWGKWNGNNVYFEGNTFDVEAIYFDNDADNAYIAIITGFPFGGGTAPGNPWFYPGDIGIDKNGDGKYEYAIDVREYDTTNNKANFYGNAAWKSVYYPQFDIAGPWEISSGNIINTVDFAYSGYQNSHYVLEAAIPLSYMGLNPQALKSPYPLAIHWTMQCGNDYINLPADVNPTPEPATLSLLGLGLLGLAGLGRKKK
jgi:hypothetical protein